MRNIFKDVTLTIDGSSQNFRLTKPDAFSGVESFFQCGELRVELYADYYEGYYTRSDISPK